MQTTILPKNDQDLIYDVMIVAARNDGSAGIMAQYCAT